MMYLIGPKEMAAAAIETVREARQRWSKGQVKGRQTALETSDRIYQAAASGQADELKAIISEVPSGDRRVAALYRQRCNTDKPHAQANLDGSRPVEVSWTPINVASFNGHVGCVEVLADFCGCLDLECLALPPWMIHDKVMTMDLLAASSTALDSDTSGPRIQNELQTAVTDLCRVRADQVAIQNWRAVSDLTSHENELLHDFAEQALKMKHVAARFHFQVAVQGLNAMEVYAVEQLYGNVFEIEQTNMRCVLRGGCMAEVSQRSVSNDEESCTAHGVNVIHCAEVALQSGSLPVVQTLASLGHCEPDKAAMLGDPAGRTSLVLGAGRLVREGTDTNEKKFQSLLGEIQKAANGLPFDEINGWIKAFFKADKFYAISVLVSRLDDVVFVDFRDWDVASNVEKMNEFLKAVGNSPLRAVHIRGNHIDDEALVHADNIGAALLEEDTRPSEEMRDSILAGELRFNGNLPRLTKLIGADPKCWVRFLDVSGRELGGEGGKALAECLKSNTTITQVSLYLFVHANSKNHGAAARFAIPHVRKVFLR